jgi:hypothetical protein
MMTVVAGVAVDGCVRRMHMRREARIGQAVGRQCSESHRRMRRENADGIERNQRQRRANPQSSGQLRQQALAALSNITGRLA